MAPQVNIYKTLLLVLRSIGGSRQLIYVLVKREILARYRGSLMGLIWSFFNPVLMLGVYTFMFSVIFKARWPGGGGSSAEFALVLFSGLMIFNMFSECINRAPGLIVSSVNLVKKVIFPLEILPIVTMGAAIFHMVISFLVWFIFYTFCFGMPPITILLFPLILVPHILLILGFSWFLASLGVYLRDVGQVIGVITTAIMFLSPVFFSLGALPEKYQDVMQLNPLAFIIEQARGLMIWGQPIQWSEWVVWLVVSICIAGFGLLWFQKTRQGFSDVL